MEIISCPECGKEVSESASICPNCGYSIHRYIEMKNASERKTKRRTVLKEYKLQILTLVICCVIIIAFFVGEKIHSNRISRAMEEKICTDLSSYLKRRAIALEKIDIITPHQQGTYRFSEEHYVVVKYCEEQGKIEIDYSFAKTEEKESENLYLASMIGVVSFAPDNIDYYLLEGSSISDSSLSKAIRIVYMRDPETRKFECIEFENVPKAIQDYSAKFAEGGAELKTAQKAIQGILESIGLSTDFSKVNEFN